MIATCQRCGILYIDESGGPEVCPGCQAERDRLRASVGRLTLDLQQQKAELLPNRREGP